VGLPRPDQLPSPQARFNGNPSLSGHKGGHDTDLRAMAESGITLVGRIAAIEGDRMTIAPGLAATLRQIDDFFRVRFQGLIDKFVDLIGEDAPPDDNVWSTHEPPEPESLDLGRAGISTVLWTSGFRPDYRWIDAPVTDDMGLPRTDRGVSAVPGLFFVGALWQTNQLSATLFGPRVDSRHIGEAMGLTLPEEEPLAASS